MKDVIPCEYRDVHTDCCCSERKLKLFSMKALTQYSSENQLCIMFIFSVTSVTFEFDVNGAPS